MRPLNPVSARMRATTPWLQRLLGGWWRRQPPARQDRYATLGPLVSVLLFLAAIISSFWYLRNEEFEREQQSVKRDAEIAQQQIRQRLIENQEQFSRLARELPGRGPDPVGFFAAQAARSVQGRPEVTRLIWLDANRTVRAAFQLEGGAVDADDLAESGRAALPDATPGNAPAQAFAAARTQRRTAYSRPYASGAQGTPAFQLQLPLAERGGFAGVLAVEYSVEALLRQAVPAEVKGRHSLSLLDARRRLLASTVLASPGDEAQPRSASIVHTDRKSVV